MTTDSDDVKTVEVSVDVMRRRDAEMESAVDLIRKAAQIETLGALEVWKFTARVYLRAIALDIGGQR